MSGGHDIRTCCRCGAEFKVFLSDAAAGAGKYCSEPCTTAARTHHDDVLCFLPATVYELAMELRMSERNTANAVRRMATLGMLHPVGLKRETVRPGYGLTTFTLVYDIGAQTDPRIPDDFKLARTFFYDRALLLALPGTSKQLEQRTGFTKTTVSRRLDALRAPIDEHGRHIHTFISRWRQPKQGPVMGVHTAGPGKDRPCNLSLVPRKLRDVRYRKKVQVSAERKAELAEKRARRSTVRKLIEQGDPMINAMFGTPQQRKSQQPSQ